MGSESLVSDHGSGEERVTNKQLSVLEPSSGPHEVPFPSIFIEAPLPSAVCLSPSPLPKLEQSSGHLQEGILTAGSSPAGTGVCQTVKQFVNHCCSVTLSPSLPIPPP